MFRAINPILKRNIKTLAGGDRIAEEARKNKNGMILVLGGLALMSGVYFGTSNMKKRRDVNKNITELPKTIDEDLNYYR